MFENGKTAEAQAQFAVQPDRRADEGERRVRVGRRDVLITRRLAGVAMMITVPVRAYRGVALDIEPQGDGGASYRLSLTHRDPDLDVVLAETADGGAVSADWKYWAAYLDLPRLSCCDGALETLDPRLGEVAFRGALARRRNVSVQQRRPRFSARRKLGATERLEVVHEDEREIISYE
jgi:hypothetical protein